MNCGHNACIKSYNDLNKIRKNVHEQHTERKICKGCIKPFVARIQTLLLKYHQIIVSAPRKRLADIRLEYAKEAMKA